MNANRKSAAPNRVAESAKRSVHLAHEPEVTLLGDKGPAERPVRIVVVDDHRFMREVIAAMLRRQELDIRC